MEEIKNNEVEVTTEVSGAEEVTQEITIEESSAGPSKSFVALVVGGIAAAVVGTVVAVKRHKKKKADAEDPVEEDYEDEYDFYDEEEIDLAVQKEGPAIQVVEESKENSGKKKG